MRRKPRSAAATLNQAVALLIKNEAAFVARMAKTDELMAEYRERFERIERRLAAIETALRELPQVLRREIGFKR